MAGSTTIEWAERVWNPTRGCSRVSPGCRGCYAERMAIRQSRPGKAYEGLVRSTPNGPRWTGVVRLVGEALEVPLHWRKPRRIFVNSMSDLFHEALSFEQVDRVVDVMLRARQHQYLILTKRADRMAEYVRDRSQRGIDFEAHPQIWFGTSVESQEYVWRAEAIADLPVGVRWLSCEPLLGPLDLSGVLGTDRINWIVTGGESGPGARPMDADWVRSIRDQCLAAGVPFFHKQNGGVRKKRAGRLLDGRTWDEFPSPVAPVPVA